MPQPYNWLKFETELATGISIPAAARKCDIPLEEAEDHCKKLMSRIDLAPVALASVAYEALREGMAALKESTKCGDEAVKARAGADLIKAGLELHKLAGNAKPRMPRDVPIDPDWNPPEEENKNWRLKATTT